MIAPQRCLVDVHNEWDPLEEVIVGTAIGARRPGDDPAYTFVNTRGGRREAAPPEPFPDWLIEETEEDLDALVRQFELAGVTVRRARPVPDPSQTVTTPHWTTSQYFPYCPRDVLLAIGHTIIESPSFTRSRYFEALSYRHLLVDYVRSGASWISAPPPRLADTSYDPEAGPMGFLRDVEPIFDAANVVRMGRDLLYLVSVSGNAFGAEWLQAALGSAYRVHTSRGLYTSVHIDSTILPLRPGLVLLNPERVAPDRVPEVFSGWDALFAPDMVEYRYSEYPADSSKWLGMNLMMITPELAFVDAHQAPLMKLLGRHGIECVPIRLRHGRTLGGGVHCVTLDVRRRGTLEDYRA